MTSCSGLVYRRRPTRTTLSLCGLILAALGVLAATGVARAATIPVTSTADTGAGSLRQAITTAEGNGEADTIDIQVSGTVQLLSALPNLTTEMDIAGPAAGFTVNRPAGPAFRIFNIQGGDVSMSHLTISGGSDPGGTGSGIENTGTLDLDHVTVTGNNPNNPVSITGGAIDSSGPLTLTDSVVTNNQATGAIFGLGAGITNNSTMTMTRSTVSQNFLIVPALASSGLALGGGIFNGAGGTMTATDSTIAGNLVVTGLGSGSADVEGGGIFSQGTVTLDHSTVSGNSVLSNTSNGAGSVASSIGGGIEIYSPGSLTLKSSTVTANQASASSAQTVIERGDGIDGTSTPSVTLLGSTVDKNPSSGSGSNVAGPVSLTSKGSLLSQSSASAVNCSGANSVTSQGYNFDSDGSCISSAQTGDQVGTSLSHLDPQLGALQDNGGPTFTQSIPNTSPALDGGIATGSSTDQRGKARPADLPEKTNPTGGDGTDIGAFEYQPSADLSVDQTESADPVTDGDQITYTATVHNAGPDSAAASTLTDTLPAGTSFVSAPAGCNHVSGVVTCDLGVVASGASPSVAIVVHADSPGTPSNDLAVATTTTESDSTNNTDSESTTIDPMADLSITQTDSADPVTVGDSITYTLTVDNNGPDDAAAVMVTDTLPSGTSFDSASTGCSHLSGVVTCDLGAVTSGATPSVAITVHADTAGAPSNEATVSSETADDDSTNDTSSETTTIDPLTDLSITQTDSPDPVTVGDPVIYTLTVHNGGPSDASDLTVVDTLSAGLGFASAPLGCTPAGQVVTCELASLDSGSSAQLAIHTTAAVVGDQTNLAEVSSPAEDPDETNNSASETTTVVAKPVVPPGTAVPPASRKCVKHSKKRSAAAAKKKCKKRGKRK